MRAIEIVEFNQIFADDCRLVLEYSSVGQCQAAVAKAVESFGKVDVLFCCASQGKKRMKRMLIEFPGC